MQCLRLPPLSSSFTRWRSPYRARCRLSELPAPPGPPSSSPLFLKLFNVSDRCSTAPRVASDFRWSPRSQAPATVLFSHVKSSAEKTRVSSFFFRRSIVRPGFPPQTVFIFHVRASFTSWSKALFGRSSVTVLPLLGWFQILCLFPLPASAPPPVSIHPPPTHPFVLTQAPPHRLFTTTGWTFVGLGPLAKIIDIVPSGGCTLLRLRQRRPPLHGLIAFVFFNLDLQPFFLVTGPRLISDSPPETTYFFYRIVILPPEEHCRLPLVTGCSPTYPAKSGTPRVPLPLIFRPSAFPPSTSRPWPCPPFLLQHGPRPLLMVSASRFPFASLELVASFHF